MDLILYFLYQFIEVYIYVMIAYIIMGFFPQIRMTKFYEILSGAVEPLLYQFRFLSYQGISFAPIAVFLILSVIQRIISELSVMV